MKRIFLIAGGPSGGHFQYNPLRKFGQLMGVNDCGFRVEGVSHIITMDRLWTENRWNEIRDLPAMFIVRESVYKRFQSKIHNREAEPPGRLKVEAWPMDHAQSALSLEPGKLNGRNSGFCAFNYAVQQRPDELYLFGFDMTGDGEKRHWHPSYLWSRDKNGDHYKKWAVDFDEAKMTCAQLGVRVYNCSAISKISAFPRIHNQQELMERLA